MFQFKDFICFIIMLPIPSNEQANVVLSLKNNNVLVDSVAGSGKNNYCIIFIKNIL